MKKENSLVKFTTFVLLITIIAVALVSGTYAKYTSTATGSDTATVAKWSIIVGEGEKEVDIASNKTVTFNLFNTLTNESNVAKTDGTLIAPGTTGSFDLKINNASQVTAEYAISFKVEDNNAGIPLEFKVGDGNWTKGSIPAVDTTKLEMNKDNTVTVSWRWVYEVESDDANVIADADTADTKLGVSTPSITVTATITATQVD